MAGNGYPLLLMHGGPGADHWTLLPFRQPADQFTLIFYDHRCDGRSQGTPVSSMNFENLTADADALRRRLGYQRWAVLGHWFGGHVALEYALRCPGSLSHLVLVDTGGDSASGASATPATLAASSAAPARPWPGGRLPFPSAAAAGAGPGCSPAPGPAACWEDSRYGTVEIAGGAGGPALGSTQPGPLRAHWRPG